MPRIKSALLQDNEPLLTPGEVASLFSVDPKTVTRWDVIGELHSIRTPGGHRRYRESEVKKLLRSRGIPAQPDGGPEGETALSLALAGGPACPGQVPLALPVPV